MKLNTIAALMTVVAIVASMSSCKNNDSVIEKIDLIPVKTSKEGNWSMIDKKGKIVYDAEFKNTPTVAYNGLFSVEESDGYTVYSASGNKPTVIGGLERLKSVGYMEDGLIPVTFPNSRISVVDQHGSKKFELTPIKNQEVVACANGYSDGLLRVVLEDDKVGYVDDKGKVVIQPKYDRGADFREGLAVVAVRDADSGDLEYLVINKSGEKQFALKDGYEPVGWPFYEGKLLVQNEDRYYFFDKKGEKTKLSSKFKSILNYMDNYILFLNDDGLYGVGDMEGEIIIRPKYSYLEFLGDDEFLAQKEGESDTYVLLDKNGEVKKELDYKEILYLEEFGYFAKDGRTYSLLNDKLESKCKEDIYEIALSKSPSYQVSTDYFDVSGVANSIVGMIGADGMDNYRLGATANQVMSGKEPSDYTYKSECVFEDLAQQGFRYNVSVKGVFTANIANYDYDLYSYNYNYYWNPNSKLGGFMINVSSESEWGENGFKALKSSLASAGFKEKKSGVADGDYAALYEKGNEMVAIKATPKSTDCYLLVYSNSMYPSYTSQLSQAIDPNGKVNESDSYGNTISKPEYYEDINSIVADTVVVEEAVEVD